MKIVSIAVMNGPHLEKLFDVSERDDAEAHLKFVQTSFHYSGPFRLMNLTKKDEKKLLNFIEDCCSDIGMGRAARYL